MFDNSKRREIPATFQAHRESSCHIDDIISISISISRLARSGQSGRREEKDTQIIQLLVGHIEPVTKAKKMAFERLTQPHHRPVLTSTMTTTTLPLTKLRPEQPNKTHTNSSAQISIQKYRSLNLYLRTPTPRNPPKPPKSRKPPNVLYSRYTHAVISMYAPLPLPFPSYPQTPRL